MSQSSCTVRAGFIGMGNFVAGNHLPNMSRSPLWTIQGICDVDAATLGRIAARFPAPVQTVDYGDILRDPDVDVVFIGTRHDLHERLIVEAAAAGKDIFVEKPMSKTTVESRRIIDAVQRAGVRLMVGYNRRFAPSLLRAREIFRSRNRGKPAMVTYRAVDDASLWPAWPFDPKVGGGKVMSEGCHFYDLLSWFLEEEPVSVQCSGGRSDNNFIQITFAGGSLACVVSGGGGAVTYPKERMEVFCHGTTLVLDHFLRLTTDGYGPATVEDFPFSADPYPATAGRDPVETYRLKMARWREEGVLPEDCARKAYYGTTPAVDKGHCGELAAYARAILDGAPSPCDEIDGARATAMALKAIESLEAGGVPKALGPEEYLLSRKRRAHAARTPAAALP